MNKLDKREEEGLEDFRLNGEKSKVALLYKDESPASEEVEKELQRRKIAYRVVWDIGSSRPRPAIRSGGLFVEGLSVIKFLYFGMLDAGFRLKESGR